MAQVKTLIGQQGMTFTNSFVSFSLCCPSRTTFLTGQYAHNHQVLSNDPLLGGYGKFATLHRSDNLAVWLHEAGYATAHIGKYLNGYGEEDGDSTYVVPACRELPQGWDEWYGGLDPYNYAYHNYVLNENGGLVVYGTLPADFPPACQSPPVEQRAAIYRTDLEAAKAVEFINKRAAATDKKPFFLSVAFLAVHEDEFTDRRDSSRGLGSLGPEPAPGDQGRFAQAALPPKDSFSEAIMSDKPFFMRLLPAMGFVESKAVTQIYRHRMETLLAVDRAVQQIIDALASTGALKRTVIIFTSDNGFFHGEHRLPAGKGLLYEEAIRVPLLIRGPGVAAGRTTDKLVGNVDLAPTILELAQATTLPSTHVLDGRSLVPLLSGQSVSTWRTAFLVEAGEHTPEEHGSAALRTLNPRYGDFFKNTPSYAAVRTARYLYGEYWTGERELYNFTTDLCHHTDAGQLKSQHRNPCYSARIEQLRRQLQVLKTCAGASCWQ